MTFYEVADEAWSLIIVLDRLTTWTLMRYTACYPVTWMLPLKTCASHCSLLLLLRLRCWHLHSRCFLFTAKLLFVHPAGIKLKEMPQVLFWVGSYGPLLFHISNKKKILIFYCFFVDVLLLGYSMNLEKCCYMHVIYSVLIFRNSQYAIVAI